MLTNELWSTTFVMPQVLCEATVSHCGLQWTTWGDEEQLHWELVNHREVTVGSYDTNSNMAEALTKWPPSPSQTWETHSWAKSETGGEKTAPAVVWWLLLCLLPLQPLALSHVTDWANWGSPPRLTITKEPAYRKQSLQLTGRFTFSFPSPSQVSRLWLWVKVTSLL